MRWTYISTLQTKTSLGACRKCLCWLPGLSGSAAKSSTPTGQPRRKPAGQMYSTSAAVRSAVADQHFCIRYATRMRSPQHLTESHCVKCNNSSIQVPCNGHCFTIVHQWRIQAVVGFGRTSPRSTPITVYIGWSDVTYLWSQCDRHFVGQQVVLCVVKWWRFDALFEYKWISWFKKMSVW